MNSIEADIMKGMVSILNEAIEAYHNGKPIISDIQFDTRLDDLKQLEEDTGFVLENSPTRTNTDVSNKKIITEQELIEMINQ